MKIYRFLKSIILRPKIQFKDSTLLHLVRSGFVDKIKIDQIKESDLLYRNINNESLIRLLIANKQNNLLFKIIEKFPNFVNEKHSLFEDSTLHTAIIYNNLEAFEKLVQLTNNSNQINKKDEHILSLIYKKPDFYNFLEPRINIKSILPLCRVKILTAFSQPYADQSIIQDLIKKGILSDLSTRQLVFILKLMLKNYKYDSAEMIAPYIHFDKNFELLEKNLFGSMTEGFYKEKIIIKPQSFSEKFKFNKQKVENFHFYLGLTNKDVIRNFYQSLIVSRYSFISNIAEINTELINAIYFMKRKFEIDENLLKPLFHKALYFEFSDEIEDKLFALLANWAHRRIISIMTQPTSSVEIRDSAQMFDQVLTYCVHHKIDPKLFLPKKPKNMREIHNSLNIALGKIGRDKIPISMNLPRFVQELDESQFEGLIIKIPKNNSQLIAVGQHLAICVGNNYYANEMNKGRIAVFILYKDQRPEYCIEYDLGLRKVVQAKSHYNFDMNPNLKKKFEDFLAIFF